MKGLQKSDYFFPTNFCERNFRGFCELWADLRKFITRNKKIYSFAKKFLQLAIKYMKIYLTKTFLFIFF